MTQISEQAKAEGRAMTDKDELVERPMGYHEMHAHLTSERDKWRKVAGEMAEALELVAKRCGPRSNDGAIARKALSAFNTTEDTLGTDGEGRG